MNKRISLLLVIFLIILSKYSYSQSPIGGSGMMEVGVARVDITPIEPIRLSGYGARSHTETTNILHRLEAKAMAFGSDGQHPSVFITVDLIGITQQLTSKLVQQLSNKFGIEPANVVICASHTHGGPEIGNTINILQYREKRFTDSLLDLKHLIHIARYTEMLSQKLEEVSLAALRNRKPAFVAWGQGQASFAANRRTKGGPVDPALPLIRITDPDGKLKAVLVNYACHGTTLEGVNEINGDWIGEAKRIIESKHPGTIAMVAIGCGADADPKPRGEMQFMQKHGQEIADNVDKLLTSQLQELTTPPVGKIKFVKLPFSKIPNVEELIKTTEEKTLRGYYAWLALERLQRGEKIPTEINYPVQVWNFGDKLAMINLAGEVVVDYSIRLKNELGAEHVWVNAYANDVPSYIASRRVIQEGGYEVDFSMFCYDKPSPFVEEVEDIIINAVHDIIPGSFKLARDTVNSQALIAPGNDGSYHLTAALAKSVGPAIKYMPEWKAFGWFTTEDQVEWNVNLEKTGKYEVYLKWSVSDIEAGKKFVFESGNKKVTGKVEKTGSWFTYTKKKIGVINLAAGRQKMVFKSNAKSEKGAMLDLAEVTLIYVK